jgi:hypothetical protein
MLSMRADTMDSVQLLVRSHAPDLTRMPFYVGTAAVVVALLFLLLRKSGPISYSFVFAVATGIVPFVLFNQQVVTGLSLQPIHYQVFVGNYIAGVSAVFAVGLLIGELETAARRNAGMALIAVAVLSIVWGFVECHYTVRVLDSANLARDRAFAVGKFLSQEALKSDNPFQQTVISFASIQGDDSPTIAPQNLLWTRHQHVFAGLSWQESKERFFTQIYYQGHSPEWLDTQLKGGNFVAMIALFGWGRHSDRLTTDSKPLSHAEIEAEVGKFRLFTENFGKHQASNPSLDYLVLPEKGSHELVNVDRWYERSLAGKTNGYEIFKLVPRREK